MLDTDTVSYILKRDPRLEPTQRMSDCCISAIVLGELEFGAANSSRADELRQLLLDFTSSVTVIPLDESVSRAYGDLRYYLDRQGKPLGKLGNNDTWIAAHALTLDLPLVTNNTRYFSMVPDLFIETWMRDLK